jgi:hypothetical protein
MARVVPTAAGRRPVSPYVPGFEPRRGRSDQETERTHADGICDRCCRFTGACSSHLRRLLLRRSRPARFPECRGLWPEPNNKLSVGKSSFGATPDRIEARRIDAKDLDQTKCRKPNLSAQPLVPGLTCETGQSSCCRLDRSDNEAPGFEIAIFRDACRAACYVQ